MMDISLKEMQDMQMRLQEQYKETWEELTPETGKHMLLWMVGEIGEVIDIVKKHGTSDALQKPEVRSHLVEEMADVLMFYNDILLCYGITPEEMKEAYTAKFQRNMTRWK